MHTEHQDFTTEFPELRESIATLRESNPHFAKLLEEFSSLTAEIEHIERNDAANGSVTLEDLKKKRLAIKDELYRMATAKG
ncbi:DUF465 domain-containing protein [Candidatus Igneacidithiobacillus taiwanensis]|uniref:YdcH family protein n=1 Tax=Candidatus Igneacidithiobacillus taiwanensis TaxID=1945924 RepID=UPI00289A4C99|nr:DUF465 domain-containing protein [Candidatus Igneacidithiobacillus taiwanensis]